MSSRYLTFTPGKYYDWEKKMVEERFELAEKGPAKGFGVGKQEVSEYQVLHFNKKWDPYNPLFADKKYAQKAGYPNVPAFPCFLMPIDQLVRAGDVDIITPITVPENFGDVLYWDHGPNYEEFYAPIFPGDTLTTGVEKFMIEEVTVPGGFIRHFRTGVVRLAHNQKDELVARSTVWRLQAYGKLADEAEESGEAIGAVMTNLPPAHYTTNDEWEYINELWDKEYIRGKTPLYWEDVNVGDEPAWTCYGPITYMDMCRWHHNSVPEPRALIKKVLNGEWCLLVHRDRFGSYLVGVPDVLGGMNVPGVRASCYNDTCVRLIARTVTNYIGDAGFVTKVGWIFSRGVMDNRPKELLSRKPQLDAEYLNKVPYMKGKQCNYHPTETDTVIGKAYVTDKYVNDKGEHIVDFVCWGETLDKRIIEVVPISAKLLSKKA